jgi:hypothetical protein
MRTFVHEDARSRFSITISLADIVDSSNYSAPFGRVYRLIVFAFISLLNGCRL